MGRKIRGDRWITTFSVMTVTHIEKGITLATWNVRGIMYGTQSVIDLIEHVDVLFICEHWLTAENESFLKSLGFSLNVESKPNLHPRKREGVAFLTKPSTKFTISRLRLKYDQMIGIKIKQNGSPDIQIIGTRLPSTNVSPDIYEQKLNELFDTYDEFKENALTIICGDLNADVTKLNKSRRDKILQTAINERGFVDISKYVTSDFPLFTYRQKGSTCKTLIDYILVPEIMEQSVLQFEILDTISYNISDHFPLVLSLDISNFESFRMHSSDITSMRWTKASDYELLLYRTETERLLNFSPETGQTQSGIELHNSQIVNALHLAANYCIPKGKWRPFLKPYWKPKKLNNLHFDMREARRRWKAANYPRSKDDIFFYNYKEAKRIFRKAKRRAENEWYLEMYKDAERAAEIDIGFFYKTVKRQKRSESGDRINNIKYESATGLDKDDQCSIWKSYFCDLATPDTTSCFDKDFKRIVEDRVLTILENKDTILETDNDLMYNHISCYEIQQTLKEFKAGKAPGPDKIMVEHLRYAGNILFSHLSNLFNTLVNCGYTPKMYRTGEIIPVYKRNNKDRSEPSNYRGITLTSVIAKLFEKLILNRIMKVIELSGVPFPNPLQFGSRKDHGALTAAFVLHDSISFFLERSSPVFALFLDNAKAFDRVWIHGLLYKLYRLGIHDKLFYICSHLYLNSFSCVKLMARHLIFFPIRQGVGQGRVLSAFMFLVYVNDLLDELDTLNCGLIIGHMHIPAVMLVDDIAIVSSSLKALQSALNVTGAYAYKWRLYFNPGKSCCMLFSKAGMTLNTSLTLDGTPIARKNENKYAGVLFTEHLDVKRSIKTACNKSRQQVCALKSAGLNSNGISPIACVKIWQRVILATAMYGCEIWTTISDSCIEDLEKSQRHFARTVQNLNITSPSDTTIYNLGLFSMEGHIDKCRLLLLGRLCRANQTYCFKQLFTMFVAMWNAKCSLGVLSVCMTIFQTLVKYKLVEYFQRYLDLGVFPDKRMWTRVVLNSIARAEELKWKNSLSLRLGLENYSLCHNKLQPHVFIILSTEYPYMRPVFSYMLNLISMRKISQPCQLCKRVTEDLFKHLFCSCSALLKMRDEFYEQIVDQISVPASLEREQLDDDFKFLMCFGWYSDSWNYITKSDWITIIKLAYQYVHYIVPHLPSYHTH